MLDILIWAGLGFGLFLAIIGVCCFVANKRHEARLQKMKKDARKRREREYGLFR